MHDRPGFIINLASLVDSDRVWETAQRTTLDAFRGTWTPELERQLVGQSVPGMIRLMANAVDHLSGAERKQLKIRLLSNFDDLVDAGELKLHRGATEMLDELTRRAIRVAVISTMPAAQARRCVRRAGLPGIDSLQTSDRQWPLTPSPTLHLAAADDLKVDAGLSVAIDHDSLGLRSAHKAGMLAVADPTVARPSCTYNHLDRYQPIDVAAYLKAAALPRAA